ncbi:putative transposon protein [Symbiodinium microadriaticum]|uniref:Putative transposon protein n=1 Tax=Symbiodinium microadriaticum TaxID=2951 RepID=A0A1Q9F7Q6_SYMMI|nr:putative transposon protein [Symbiodinium microadriaticum]
MGKNLRYLLVAKYLVPKAYIEDFSGKVPPDDNGMQVGVSETTKGEPGQEPGQLPVEEIQTIEDFFKENSGGDHCMDGPVAVEALTVEEELDYEPSEPEDEGEDDPSQEGQVADVLMQEGDCDPPPMSFLTFAAALPNNRSSTVRQALQDVMMYLQMHGMPVYRFHSDKGEFFSNQFRLWLREMGIYGTWSEPSVPQSNGHAESTVRWIKDRTRTLLRSAALPVKLWPVAAAMAAAEQRGKVLNWKSKLAAPFGATVYLRKKAFDKYGPLRRENGLESKRLKGRYVGLSTIVHRGHLVYIPGSDGEKERFLHTLHVRSNLIETEPPDMELVVDDVPKPRRRLGEKSRIEDIELRAVDASGDEVKQWATEEAKGIVENWNYDYAKLLINKLAKAMFFNERKFGVYRHGGSVGWMKGMQEFPDLVRLLTKFVAEAEPAAAFTSVLVSYNTQKALHKDFNNDPRTYNYVIPTKVPARGGELWIELKPGDCVKGTIEQRSTGDRLLYGQCIPLEEDQAIRIGPMNAHEVCPWEGDRIVVIGYSPQCLGKLNYDDVGMLHDYGFPIPLSQLPEYYGNEQAEDIQLGAVEVASEEESDGNLEESDWIMYLDLDPGMVRIVDRREGNGELPHIQKTEVVYTPNIEDVLTKLSGPLDVTYTVNPAEVMSCLERWKPAIEKELKSIEVAIERLSPGSEERRKWLNRPGVQRLPTKFVFTVKPNDQAEESNPATWFKRKARLVVCGNMAAEDGAAVYTETAPAEAVRAGLTLATRFRWTVAVLDVVAAFLRTPMNRSAGDPIVVVQPPRLLEVMGLAIPMELWGLVRALYGLRQSPALWGDFRDYTLRSSEPPGGMRLQQGGAATSWWKVVNTDDQMIAIILVYVDDFLLCGPTEVVSRLATWIRGIWETSNPTLLAPGTPIRFLGMELQVDDQFPEEVSIGQQGYIQELLRLHAIPPTAMSKIPISKELVAEREAQKEVNPSDVHLAQQLTGEILWVAQRSRPDLSYTSSVMASLCLKQPQQVIEIGLKTLGYLQRTAGYQLRIRGEGDSLVMFCDAAYAPQNARSHGGWLVMYGGSPIMWRSGKQVMVTLSTAEAELLAIIDGAIALKVFRDLNSLQQSTFVIVNHRGDYAEVTRVAKDLCMIMTCDQDWRNYRSFRQESFTQHFRSLPVLIARSSKGILGFYSGAVMGHDHDPDLRSYSVYHNLFIEHVKNGFEQGEEMIDLGTAGDDFKHELGAQAFRLVFSLRSVWSLRGALALTLWASHSWLQVLLRAREWPLWAQAAVSLLVGFLLWCRLSRWLDTFNAVTQGLQWEARMFASWWRKELETGACSVREFWSPLASTKARKQVMKRRADVELVVGLVMLTGVFLFVCAPITVILFWNFMMMRYMMSTWTQDSFQRLDGLLSPVLTSVPGVKQAYQALQAWLYSFVDPNSKSAGKLCTIL